MSNAVMLWEGPKALVLPQSAPVSDIANAAIQLRPRERNQVISNFEAGHYEVGSSYVWLRAMGVLRNELSKLGYSFLAELLQRPDINEESDINKLMTDSEAIELARNLGMLTPTQTMRLSQAQVVVNHFGSGSNLDLADEDEMSPAEAYSCLHICVQSILGQQTIAVAEDFAAFRNKLSAQTLDRNSGEILRLQQSPYFFIRTALGVLISALRSSQGAQLEHASRNTILIIPMFWSVLKDPERWQIGQAYSVEFNEGRKDIVKALHQALVTVNGFDYVPENLRSNTFIRIAASVIAAHQAANNFYNEPAPMKELASLGTSIPGPALAICMTAALCVRLGNSYGVSWAAQDSANIMLSQISVERWQHYINGRLPDDHTILSKLIGGPTSNRWIELVRPVGLDPNSFQNAEVRKLIRATNTGASTKVSEAAKTLYYKAIGLT